MPNIEIISSYKNKTDLKNQIINQYMDILNRHIKMWEGILADEKWASSGSEYHNRCREEMAQKIENVSLQIKILQKK